MEQFPIELVPLHPYYWPWIKQRVHIPLCEDTRGVVAIQEIEPVAAAIFDHFTWNSCQMHLVIEEPRITRRLLRESGNYVFNTCGMSIVYALVPENSKAAVRFSRWGGFNEIFRLKDAIKSGVDTILFELRKEEYNRVFWRANAVVANAA